MGILLWLNANGNQMKTTVKYLYFAGSATPQKSKILYIPVTSIILKARNTGLMVEFRWTKNFNEILNKLDLLNSVSIRL